MQLALGPTSASPAEMTARLHGLTCWLVYGCCQVVTYRQSGPAAGRPSMGMLVCAGGTWLNLTCRHWRLQIGRATGSSKSCSTSSRSESRMALTGQSLMRGCFEFAALSCLAGCL